MGRYRRFWGRMLEAAALRLVLRLDHELSKGRAKRTRRRGDDKPRWDDDRPRWDDDRPGWGE